MSIITNGETFWGNNYEPDAVQLLHIAIDEALDASGPNAKSIAARLKLPALEEWRKFKNPYYRHYNDGDSPYGRLRHMFERHAADIAAMQDKTFPLGIDDNLERLGRVVFAAAVAEFNAAPRTGS